MGVPQKKRLANCGRTPESQPAELRHACPAAATDGRALTVGGAGKPRRMSTRAQEPQQQLWRRRQHGKATGGWGGGGLKQGRPGGLRRGTKGGSWGASTGGNGMVVGLQQGGSPSLPLLRSASAPAPHTVYLGPAPRSPDVSQMSPINRRFPHVVIKVHKPQAANMNKRVAL